MDPLRYHASIAARLFAARSSDSGKLKGEKK
jgi:hypothetical protein